MAIEFQGKPLKFTAVFDSLKAEKDMNSFFGKIKDANKEFQNSFPAPNTSGITEYKKAQIAIMESLAQARLDLLAQKKAQEDLNTAFLQGKIDIQNFRNEQTKLNAARKEQARIDRETKRQLAQTSEYSKLTSALNSVRKETKNVLAELVSLENQGKRNSQSFKDLSAKANDLVRQTNILDKQVKKIDIAVGQHQRNVGNYGDAISMVLPQLSQFAGRLGLIGVAVGAVQQSFKSNLQFEPLQQGLKSVTASGQQVNDTLEFLRQTSDRLGLQFTSTADSFKMWQGAARYSNLTANESRRIFESVANAGAKMKLSNDQVQGTFLALSQMMSKGKVQAEELRGQLAERLPGAFQLAAQAMGVTEQELNKMLEKGEVIAQDFLPRFAEQLDKSFGSDKTDRVEGMQASINRLSNEFDRLWQSDRAQRFFTVVIDGFADLTRGIGSLVKSESWQEFFLRLGGKLTGGLNGQIMDIGAEALNKTSVFNSKSISAKANEAYLARIEDFAKKDRDEQFRVLAETKKTLNYYVNEYKKEQNRTNKENLKNVSQRLADINKFLSEDGAFSKKGKSNSVDQKSIDKAQREAEKLAEQQRQAFERQRSLQFEIDKINENATKRNLNRDQQEIASIKEKYAKIREEIRKFNSDPKNNGLSVDSGGLSKSEKQEINDAIYKQQTAKILKIYQDDYQNFVRYEDLKKQYGVKVADDQLGKYKDVYQKIAGEYAGLLTKQRTVGITWLEKERMLELEKLVVAHGKRIEEQNLSQYLEAIKLSDTYNDQLLTIEKKYQEAFTALGENASEERKEQLRKALQEEVSQLTVANIQKEMQWDRVIQGLQNKTKSGANKSLDYLMQGVNTKFKLGKLSKKDYDDLTGQIDNARFEINLDKSWVASTDALNRYRAAVKAYGKDSDQARKAQKELFTSFSEDISKAQAIISSLDQGLQTLGVSGFEDVFKNVQGVLDGAMDIASGKPIRMITGGIKVLTNAISLFNTKDKKLQKQIDAYKTQLDSLGKAYDKLQRQITSSVGESFYTDSDKAIANLREQQRILAEMARAEEEKKKTDKEKVKGYYDEIDSINKQIEDIQKAITENLVQTTFKDLSASLADALVTAFEAGESAVDSLDETFDKFIKNALVNSLKLKMIEPIVNDMVNQLADYMKSNNNSLTGFNFSVWKDKIDGAGTEFTKTLEEAYKKLGLSKDGTSSGGGLKGSIQRELTESTASELTGLYRASFELQKKAFDESKSQGISMGKQLLVAMDQLTALNAIQVNTAATVQRLDAAVGELQLINKNLGGRF